MNKSHLVDAVANAAEVGKREVDKVVAAVIDTITVALQRGEKVSLPGLGNLTTTKTLPRLGRNPRTGATVRIPAGVRVKFSASTALKDAVAKKPAARKSTVKKSTAGVKASTAKKKAPARKATAKKR